MAFPSTNLVHYWKADSNMNDGVGSNNGTDTNTPTYTSGKISNAFTCAASSSQYSLISSTGLFGTDNTYTFNVWVKLVVTTGNQGIAMNHVSAGDPLFYFSSPSIVHSKSGVSDLVYNWTGRDTGWHMWTFVGDGSGMRTYLDGNSTPVATNANTTSLTSPGTTTPFGGYKNGGAMQAGWYLDGQLDEIGIWSTALSTTDISTLYNSGTGITYPDAASGPANLKSYNTNVTANIKSINTNLIANVKSLDTNV